MYTKEEVLRSAKQQLDQHIYFLRIDFGLSKGEIESELYDHIKKVLKIDSKTRG
ncbi:hypothetical protein ANABIO32_02180 [Rossellomorea marisflavi]|nr:hypothetical protein ANABIO32_02180 [Rossellomorea marisflavi]